ncbi:glycosyltransferase [Arachidicoccus sp.]|uniref:glycosyltransferase n=1 Tax=Arachidicoccus sp. TaxID=1872624 RepID=UPI003D25ACD9
MKKLNEFAVDKNLTPQVFFSVIIPARNEEANIRACILSILENFYPKKLLEIIVIDDFSTDKTVEIILQLQTQYPQLKLLRLKDLLSNGKINSYKKKALTIAIEKAMGDWVITTDADCIIPINWLSNFDNYIQQNDKKFIAAPVVFVDKKTFLSRFQCLDFLSLQGITAASVSAGVHSMCNGANLCYKKDIFFEVGGFSGIDNLASGDDMLLMHKIQKRLPDSIGYLYAKGSIVQTLPMPTWKTFINQRIRWASKASSYDDKKIMVVLWLVYLLNVFLLALLLIAFFYPILFLSWLILVAVKMGVELLFMKEISGFYQQKSLLKWFPLMQPLHIAYTVIAGFWGKFGKYSWKDRNVN